MRRGRRVGALVVSLAAALLPAGRATGELPLVHLDCGDTVVSSLRLQNNILKCNDGLIIGAPDITVDLNGHRLNSVGVAGDIGIDDSAGHDGVTIKNGSVVGFDKGILLNGVTDAVIQDIEVLDALSTGINVESSTGVTIKRSKVSGAGGSGISAIAAFRTKVRDTTVTNNGAGIGFGIASDDLVIERNDISGNAGTGLNLRGSGNHVTNNTIDGNGGDGLVAFDVHQSTVERNDITGNLDGVSISSSSGNEFIENTLARNAHDGLDLESGDDNAVKDNVAGANSEDGIEVDAGFGNTIARNTTDENGQNGILATTASVTIKKNKARRNGFLNGEDDDVGLGVSAPVGTAGFDNTAQDNDDPVECDPSPLC